MRRTNNHLATLVQPIKDKRKLKIPGPRHAQHGSGPVKSIRTDEHHGKKIEIHTTYKFYIDGKLIKIHASVLNNGKVHCHNLPQYAFSSAIRMMKSIINLMEFDMPENELLNKPSQKRT